MRRLWVWNVVIAVVVIGIVIGVGNYIYQRVTYISTNNARVHVATVTIAATATGQLTDWSVVTGDPVRANQRIGLETAVVAAPSSSTAGAGTVNGRAGVGHAIGTGSVTGARVGPVSMTSPIQSTLSLTSPINGTVLMADAVPNEVVTQGQPLAVVADLSKVSVLAYIDEGQVRNVSSGQTVDVYLDAYPGTRFDGSVQSVGNVAGDALSPLAGLSQSSGTSQVTQRVPVNVSVDFQGKYVVPGMSASIRIHR